MALRIEVVIEGEDEVGPIDLGASLARLWAMLEAADDAADSTVTLRLSPTFTARRAGAGADDGSHEAFRQVWASRQWVVRATAEPADL